MSAQAARRRSSLGRNSTRPQRERRLSMELPERLRYDADEEDEEAEDDAAGKEGQPPPFMHQSIFGMIAAAQSKFNFRSRFHEALTESEDEDDSTPSARLPKHSPQIDKSAAPPSSSKTKHRHRLSEHKLLKALPGVRSKSSKSSTRTPSSSGSSKTVDGSVPTTPALPLEQDSNRAIEAPIMSQMLQAHAKADIESSEATLTKPKSGRQSPTPSLRSQTTSVALPSLLKDIFQFDSAEEVIAEYPCWYLQSVLLEGYMYITQNHISFYAYLPKKANTVIRSGHLAKRGRRNPQYRRWWFVLKGDVLSYFADPSDPYFPRDSIDLRYGISAQLLPEKDKTKDITAFSVTTANSRTFYFRADTPQSAKEWVKQLQKIIFRSRNDGDSVKISIPTDNVIEVEENPLLDFAETIRIKVIDNDETFAVDEYFFSFFGYGEKVLADLRIMTQDTSAQRALTGSNSPLPVSRERKPSTAVPPPMSPSPSPGILHENVRATLSPASANLSSHRSPRTSGEFSRSSLDIGRPAVDRKGDHRDRGRSFSAARREAVTASHRREQSNSSPEPYYQPDSLATSSEQVSSDLVASMDDTDASGSHILSGSVMFHDPTIRKPHFVEDGTVQVAGHSHRYSEDRRLSPVHYQPLSKTKNDKNVVPAAAKSALQPTTATGNVSNQGTTSMPQTDSSSALGGFMRAGAIPIQRATGYLKGPGKAVASLLGTSPMEYYDKVSGMIAGGQRHYSEADGLSADDHVRDPDDEIDVIQAESRFREHFALGESERLVATYFAFLHRVLPLYGKIYISTTKLCFRSLLPGTRTKLIIPLKDVLNVDKEKGFRLGYQGMVVVIRGHEEIFFEFGKQAHRDDCTVTILRALDPMISPQASALMTEEERQSAEAAANENLLLEVARKESRADNDHAMLRNIYQSGSDAPAVLFDDPASSILDFKPQESLRIVCLTIGSRGDVQPYIALCKALLAEGHKPKIATHAEFGPWVKEHGIDFAPVEGDPAELMAICVEYGMFTPSFLLEANLRFRGFVKVLLTTSWDACKDAEVLIESPSAMAGIHIAEALSIPYFRAFTMPWTRTRAYPHAFAVPGHRLGGAYNYMSYVLFDHLFWQSTSGMINRWRGKVLGLKSTTGDKLQQDKVPFLYNFSPSVVVPPLDFSEWIRVTGYWFLNEGQDYTPPSELQKFIAKARKDGEKLVYIGFGSVVVHNSKQLTQDVIDAVLKADVRCILAKGWSDRLDKGKPKVKGEIEVPLPPSILQITYSVPHDWLFGQVDACVHHGGAGTTGASLRAGVPTIIHPFFGDQFFFSSRVQDLGVGLEVKRITTKSLGRALWVACHDHRMRAKAKVLGEQIRSEDGVGNAIKAIYRDMEYARTLIKKREALAKPMGDGTTDTEEEEPDAEEWTLVENDSDPEAASPKAMMQPEPARSRGRRRSSGLMHSSLGER